MMCVEPGEIAWFVIGMVAGIILLIVAVAALALTHDLRARGAGRRPPR